MGLRDQLMSAVKEAMKAREQKRLGTLRLIQANIKDKDIAHRTEESRDGISDDEILALFGKLIKSREDSIVLYEQGGRPELAEAERAEIAILREFMPRQLDETETKAAVAAIVAEVGAASLKDMGKVMAALKQRYTGTMDFGKAGAMVKAQLGGK
jgi:uncharacterized protein YqeY